LFRWEARNERKGKAAGEDSQRGGVQVTGSGGHERRRSKGLVQDGLWGGAGGRRIAVRLPRLCVLEVKGRKNNKTAGAPGKRFKRNQTRLLGWLVQGGKGRILQSVTEGVELVIYAPASYKTRVRILRTERNRGGKSSSRKASASIDAGAPGRKELTKIFGEEEEGWTRAAEK